MFLIRIGAKFAEELVRLPSSAQSCKMDSKSKFVIIIIIFTVLRQLRRPIINTFGIDEG